MRATTTATTTTTTTTITTGHSDLDLPPLYAEGGGGRTYDENLSLTLTLEDGKFANQNRKLMTSSGWKSARQKAARNQAEEGAETYHPPAFIYFLFFLSSFFFFYPSNFYHM